MEFIYFHSSTDTVINEKLQVDDYKRLMYIQKDLPECLILGIFHFLSPYLFFFGNFIFILQNPIHYIRIRIYEFVASIANGEIQLPQ